MCFTGKMYCIYQKFGYLFTVLNHVRPPLQLLTKSKICHWNVLWMHLSSLSPHLKLRLSLTDITVSDELTCICDILQYFIRLKSYIKIKKLIGTIRQHLLIPHIMVFMRVKKKRRVVNRMLSKQPMGYSDPVASLDSSTDCFKTTSE